MPLVWGSSPSCDTPRFNQIFTVEFIPSNGLFLIAILYLLFFSCKGQKTNSNYLKKNKGNLLACLTGRSKSKTSSAADQRSQTVLLAPLSFSHSLPSSTQVLSLSISKICVFHFVCFILLMLASFSLATDELCSQGREDGPSQPSSTSIQLTSHACNLIQRP